MRKGGPLLQSRDARLPSALPAGFLPDALVGHTHTGADMARHGFKRVFAVHGGFPGAGRDRIPGAPAGRRKCAADERREQSNRRSSRSGGRRRAYNRQDNSLFKRRQRKYDEKLPQPSERGNRRLYRGAASRRQCAGQRAHDVRAGHTLGHGLRGSACSCSG